MPDPLAAPAVPNTVDAKQVQLTALEAEEKRLTERLNALQSRTLALQDEARVRHIEMSHAYRARFEKRYPDLDCAKALAGYPAHHDAKIFGAIYRLRPPVQATMIEVDRFGAKPEPASLAPISASERIVLAWLIGVGAEANIKDLTALAHGDRLQLLRKLPEALLTKLADECSSIEAYLNVVLELELGG